jgi:hypothetical protein
MRSDVDVHVDEITVAASTDGSRLGHDGQASHQRRLRHERGVLDAIIGMPPDLV